MRASVSLSTAALWAGAREGEGEEDERSEGRLTCSLGIEEEVEGEARDEAMSNDEVRMYPKPRAHQCRRGSVSVPPRVYASYLREKLM